MKRRIVVIVIAVFVLLFLSGSFYFLRYGYRYDLNPPKDDFSSNGLQNSCREDEASAAAADLQKQLDDVIAKTNEEGRLWVQNDHYQYSKSALDAYNQRVSALNKQWLNITNQIEKIKAQYSC